MLSKIYTYSTFEILFHVQFISRIFSLVRIAKKKTGRTYKLVYILTVVCDIYIPTVYISKEREIWEKTCFNLTLAVAGRYKLATIEQLQLNGRAWEKLASHFTILLSDKITKHVSCPGIVIYISYIKQLSTVQSDIQKWRKDLVEFVQTLKQIEQSMFAKVRSLS